MSEGEVTAEQVTAVASVGTLVVIAATALAAFAQLRHASVLNALTVLNDFRKEYEAVQGAANEVMPEILARLNDPEERRAFATAQSTPWVRPAMPLLRLFELLGGYTARHIVPRDVVCDFWSPVVVRWWDECAPLIAVWRRSAGPELFENWEALAVVSRQWLATHQSSYPKDLPRIELIDPWAEIDRETVRSASEADTARGNASS